MAKQKKTASAHTTCQFVLTRGPRKGLPCGKNATKESNFCSQHTKAPVKKDPNNREDEHIPKPKLYSGRVLAVLRHNLPQEALELKTDSCGRLMWGSIVLVVVRNLKGTQVDNGLVAVARLSKQGATVPLTEDDMMKCKQYNIPFTPPTTISNSDTPSVAAAELQVDEVEDFFEDLPEEEDES